MGDVDVWGQSVIVHPGRSPQVMVGDRSKLWPQSTQLWFAEGNRSWCGFLAVACLGCSGVCSLYAKAPGEAGMGVIFLISQLRT